MLTTHMNSRYTRDAAPHDCKSRDAANHDPERIRSRTMAYESLARHAYLPPRLTSPRPLLWALMDFRLGGAAGRCGHIKCRPDEIKAAVALVLADPALAQQLRRIAAKHLADPALARELRRVATRHLGIDPALGDELRFIAAKPLDDPALGRLRAIAAKHLADPALGRQLQKIIAKRSRATDPWERELIGFILAG